MLRNCFGALLATTVVVTSACLGWYATVLFSFLLSWAMFNPSRPVSSYPKWQADPKWLDALGFAIPHSGLLIGLVIGVIWARDMLRQK
jgi:hypothetical protein